MIKSFPPVAMIPYLVLNTTVDTKWECASSRFFSLPKFRSQSRIVLSSATEYRYFPVGWTAMLLTQLSWPTNLCNISPVIRTCSNMSLSLLAEKRNFYWLVLAPFPYDYSFFRALSLASCVNLCFRNSEWNRNEAFSPSTTAIVSMTLSWIKYRLTGYYFSRFQIIILWSSAQETNVLRSSVGTTLLTQFSCPEYVFLQKPVDTSQSLMVLSLEQETMKSLSRKAT